MKISAWIALGSNLGNRRAILDAAVASLASTPGMEIRDVSSYHETPPVGGPSGQGPFLNAAAALKTSLSPAELHAALKRIEDEAGRVRVIRWGERTLDLDLLMYASKILDSPTLTLPHPRMAIRRFVLAPLAEIAPEIVDTTTGMTVVRLLENLDRRPSMVALYGPRSPLKSEVMDRLVAGLSAIPMRGEESDLPEDTPGLRLQCLMRVQRNAALLNAKRWEQARVGNRWLACDFCPELDDRRVKRIDGRSILFGPFEDEQEREQIFTSFKQLIRSLDEAVRPTFAALLPGWTLPHIPEVHAARFPLVRPLAGDAREIAAEILASCSATRPDAGLAG